MPESTELTTYRISRPRVSMTCVDRVPREVAERWLDDHKDWGSRGDQQEVPTRLAPHVFFLSLETGETVVKSDSIPLSRSLRYALSGRPARAQRAFRLGLALARAGVRSVTPLALIEHRPQVGLVRESFLIMETIAGETLRDFLLTRLETLMQEAPDEEATRQAFKSRLWESLSTEIANLHSASVRQRDLKAPNILVREQDDGGIVVHLVDLEGMTRLRVTPPRRVRIRDMARLLVSLREERLTRCGISATDWTDLVSRYLSKSLKRSPTTEEVERFIRENRRWAARKERRNRRRGRPLI